MTGDVLDVTFTCIITNTERLMNKRHKEEYYDNVLHTPDGIHVQQGSLIRGDGLTEPQGTIHEQGFRRFTVKKLEKLHKKHINFMIQRGQHGQFMKTWVFISHSKAVFNV